MRIAIGDLTLKAWENRNIALYNLDMQMRIPHTPGFISVLRSQRLSRGIKGIWKNASSNDLGVFQPLDELPEDRLPENMSSQQGVIPSNSTGVYTMDSNFDYNIAADLTPIDWDYW